MIQAFPCCSSRAALRHGGDTNCRTGGWSIIQPLLPKKPYRVPCVDDRRVLNGIRWHFRTGSPWAEIRSLDDLLQSVRPLAQTRGVGPAACCGFRRLRRRDHDDPLHPRPSPPTRSDEQKWGPANSGMGHPQGGLTSKIHALVDPDGRPAALCA